MIKLIILVIIGILIISLGYFYADAKYDDKKHHRVLSASKTLIPIGQVWCTCSTALFLISIISHAASFKTISNMEAFYEENNRIFAAAADKYPEVVQVISSQGTETMNTIQYVYLLKVEKYNTDYKLYKNYQDHWFTNNFLSHIPEHLKPIRLEEVQGKSQE